MPPGAIASELCFSKT